METKQINGKAIYSPKGKAGEYAKYAVNFYTGCSNDCTYCYCKRGVLGHAMGAPVATLKKCFKDEARAFDIFCKEVKANLETLREHGLFFSFSTDPMLENTRRLTINAVSFAVSFGIPCKILTKRADFVNYLPGEWFFNQWYKSKIAFGFTLTGHDELEPGASNNIERINTMRWLHKQGFKTFASIEPIIDLDQSALMLGHTYGYCDLYKIGLLSGKKDYTPRHVLIFMTCLIASAHFVNTMIPLSNFGDKHKLSKVKIYLKDSMYKYTKMDREKFEEKCKDIFVDNNYDLFK